MPRNPYFARLRPVDAPLIRFMEISVEAPLPFFGKMMEVLPVTNTVPAAGVTVDAGGILFSSPTLGLRKRT